MSKLADLVQYGDGRNLPDDLDQPSLFDPTPAPAAASRARRVPRRAKDSDARKPIYGGRAPFVAGSATSHAAAERAEPRRLSWREKVRLYVESRGERGATRVEIARALSIAENTVRPRVKELLDAGDLYEPHAPYVRNGCAILFHRGHVPANAEVVYGA